MPTKNPQTIKQEIVVVIDKSGSMSNCRDDVIGGFNTYIADLKKDKSIDAKLTLVMFDDYVHKLYSGKDIDQVGELCTRTYSPNGSTALNDAVMEAIDDVETRLKKSKAKNKPQVLVIVFTDGEENRSQKFKNKDDVKAKRGEKESEGWAFIFMGADMDAWAAGHSYGMSAGNTIGIGKQAIASGAQYLANRTRKAATMHRGLISGDMCGSVYAESMSSLMTLDADDLANDQEAVTLRNAIDTSSQIKAPGANATQQLQGLLNTQPLIPTQWVPPTNPAYADLMKKAAEAIKPTAKTEKDKTKTP